MRHSLQLVFFCSSLSLQGLLFFIALALSIIEWSTTQLGKSVNFFPYTWLYVFGTLGFSELAFEQIRDAYDMTERAKILFADSIRYAQFYNQDLAIWKKYTAENFIDKSDFCRLMERSDVLLSESEINDLVNNIFADSIIAKEELEGFIDLEKSNRQAAIFCNCLQSFNFVSNLSWHLGAIGYAVAYYSSGEVSELASLVSCSFFLSLVCVATLFVLTICILSYLVDGCSRIFYWRPRELLLLP